MRISDWSSDVCSADLPAAAHLYIVHPAIGHGMDSLFSTHPDTGNRIAALRSMAADPRFATAQFRNMPDIDIAPSPAVRRSALDPLGGSTRNRGGNGRSEEHTSELQSLMSISYAAFYSKHKRKDLPIA